MEYWSRSMLTVTCLNKDYWAEAFATWSQQPLELVKLHKCYGEKPNLDHVKVLSYVAYTHIPDSNCKKLDKMAQRLRFIGYTKQLP